MLSYLTADGRLERWDTDTGTLERSLRLYDPEREYFTCAAATADGRFFAAPGLTWRPDEPPSSTWLALIESDTGRVRWRQDIEGFLGKNIAVSPDGRTIAASTFADGERRLSVSDVATQSIIAHRIIDKTNIEALVFSPDGETIAIGTTFGKAQLWKWQTKMEPREFYVSKRPPRGRQILSLAFSPDGQSLATGGDVAGIRPGVSIVDIANVDKILDLGVEGVGRWYPKSVAFSRDGQFLAAPIYTLEVRAGVAVWDTDSGKVIHRFHVPWAAFTHVQFSRDGKRLAATSDSHPNMIVWDLPGGERLGRRLPGHELNPRYLKFSPADDLLITASEDASIRVWDVTTARELRVMRHDDGQTGARWIRAMDVSRDGCIIASSGLDNTVRLWQTDTGKELWRSTGHGRTGGHRSLAFSPDGTTLLSWGDDLKLRRLDVADGKELMATRLIPDGAPLPADPEKIAAGNEPHLFDGMFSPDATRFYMALGDFTYEFDTTTGQEQGGHFGVSIRRERVDVSPDNRWELSQSYGQQGTNEHPVVLLDTQDRNRIRQAALPGRHAGPVAISPDGRFGAAGYGGDNPGVRILSLPGLQTVAELPDLDAEPKSLVFSHSGKLLAIATADTSVLIWRCDAK
ncbi:MAG TPA: WD40 repeat domain-containing protein [Pirellulales bacterium]|nr:WD40 repeat domain-containing protein [Pirellulales bacterium]